MPQFFWEGFLWIAVIVLAVVVAHRIMRGSEAQKLDRAETYMIFGMGLLLLAGLLYALSAFFGWTFLPGLG